MSDRIFFGGIITLFVAVFIALVVSVIYEFKHPCLRRSSPPQTCTTFSQVGDVVVPHTYDCTPCAERSP